MVQKSAIALHDLVGRWYIQMTDFPMWLDGKRIHPMFNYTIQEKNGVKGLSDEVSFIKNGHAKAIRGFDTALNTTNTKFEWRGNGWMRILKSRWEVRYYTSEWAIIYFEKTIFTPKGYDVITRSQIPSDEILQVIKNKLKEFNIAHLTTLQHI